MQSSLTYRTNRDLFSNYYLDEHLPETEEWDEVDDDELEAAYDEIVDLYDREKSTAPKRNESQLEEKFIRPMFRKLGIPFEVEESTSRTQRRPDYGFFETEDAARDAFERREGGGDFYENAVAVADAKRWGRPLDTRGSGEHKRDFENPSYQIHVYLQETPARWAVLTDGKKWRLYYGPTSHRLDSYYEVDLPTVLEKGDLEDFKYFYLFFRHGAFLEDAGGDCFLDDVYDESNVFAQDLGEDLQDNIYEAIKILSEGYLQYPENDLDEEDLDLIHDSSLIYLYRLIFVLYAEAEGRDLLDTDNEIYEESYSLNSLKQEVAEELKSGDPKYRDWQDDLSSRLDELFELIDQGSKSRGIPKEDLHIPAYNGGLFRTDPDEDDSTEAKFLAEHTVGDAYLARVVELLTRSRQPNGTGKIFVDYSSLDVRHLGSIYEGLLEYQLHVADGPLTVDDGEYVETEEGDDVVVESGEVYLTTGSGERKATGSYYTPEYVVEYIVDETLGPLVDNVREDLVGQTTYRKGDDEAGTFADEFAERVFDLKILDPAMGSGHFLTSAVDYLAREIIDAQERQAAQQGVETVDEERDINWARRKVAQRCIYGVDLNPLATELAKVSLWLRTLAAEQPLAFLDHHLKTGNSLVGSDIEDVLANGNGTNSEDGQLTLQESFAHTRQQALEHVMERFQDLLSIDNETLEDAKEMESVYDDVREDELYQHLLAMSNVHAAEQFGFDIPSDAHNRMAEALRDDSWEQIQSQDWFGEAQRAANEQRFFHWELEFPLVFYNDDGVRKTNQGFDAVIGNPPYGMLQPENTDEQVLEYLNGKFRTSEYKIDFYVLFTERVIDLTRTLGRYGLILPNTFLVNTYAEKLRQELLSRTQIQSLAVSDDYLFEDAVVHNAIIVGDVNSEIEDPNKEIEVIWQVDKEFLRGDSELTTSTRKSVSPKNIDYTGDGSWDVRISKEVVPIFDKVRKSGRHLSDIGNINRGLVTGNSDKYISDEPKGDNWYPLLSGGDIERYSLENPTQFVELEKPPEGGGCWDEEIQLSKNKILLRQIGTHPKGTVDTEGYCFNVNIFSISLKSELDPFAILSIINSSLLRNYWLVLYQDFKRTFTQIKGSDLEDLPIPSNLKHKVSSDLQEQMDKIVESQQEKNTYESNLATLAKEISKYKSKRADLNLDLSTYISTNNEGTYLSKIGLYQPPKDGSEILGKTKVDYPNLRLGSVQITRESTDSLLIKATARFKPENEDEFETDQWGYTETDYLPAFRITNVDKRVAELIEHFVPLAVEEAGGFANFRQNATKNKSVVDRLSEIKIPDINQVGEGFGHYIDTVQFDQKLNNDIEQADRLADEIVYDLYGLTNEEVNLIESVVKDD
ncbi:TaqI-like C-terminal specificity domain-containing protein [Halorubrum sp. RMP-47]|uniref:Eco57I restriction-modification methylase domain-containing protein n=1 Tax=Halorubrum miltondacostae TaxID=3076378 RepID=UPI0035272173